MEGWIQRGNLSNINQWTFRKLNNSNTVTFRQSRWIGVTKWALDWKTKDIFWVHDLSTCSNSRDLLLTSPGLVSPSEQEVWIIWSLLLPNSENVFALLSTYFFFFERKILLFLFSYIFLSYLSNYKNRKKMKKKIIMHILSIIF